MEEAMEDMVVMQEAIENMVAMVNIMDMDRGLLTLMLSQDIFPENHVEASIEEIFPEDMEDTRCTGGYWHFLLHQIAKSY